MSRGPGRWQQMLLDALTIYEFGSMGAIAYGHLGREATRSELVAIRRAAHRLAAEGKVRAIWLGECTACRQVSGIWTCPECGAGCNRVLAVTRTTGLAAQIDSVMTLNRHFPPSLSVATARNAPEATLSAAEGTS